MTDALRAHIEANETNCCADSYETSSTGILTKAQGLALLTRLIEDDAFRTRFEQAPATAFAEIGVSPETIANMKEACLTARRLAPAEVLRASRERLAADLDTSLLVLLIPTAKC